MMKVLHLEVILLVMIIFFSFLLGIVFGTYDYKKTCEPIMSADQQHRWLECSKESKTATIEWHHD